LYASSVYLSTRPTDGILEYNEMCSDHKWRLSLDADLSGTATAAVATRDNAYDPFRVIDIQHDLLACADLGHACNATFGGNRECRASTTFQRSLVVTLVVEVHAPFDGGYYILCPNNALALDRIDPDIVRRLSNAYGFPWYTANTNDYAVELLAHDLDTGVSTYRLKLHSACLEMATGLSDATATLYPDAWTEAGRDYTFDLNAHVCTTASWYDCGVGVSLQGSDQCINEATDEVWPRNTAGAWEVQMALNIKQSPATAISPQGPSKTRIGVWPDWNTATSSVPADAWDELRNMQSAPWLDYAAPTLPAVWNNPSAYITSGDGTSSSSSSSQMRTHAYLPGSSFTVTMTMHENEGTEVEVGVGVGVSQLDHYIESVVLCPSTPTAHPVVLACFAAVTVSATTDCADLLTLAPGIPASATIAMHGLCDKQAWGAYFRQYNAQLTAGVSGWTEYRGTVGPHSDDYYNILPVTAPARPLITNYVSLNTTVSTGTCREAAVNAQGETLADWKTATKCLSATQCEWHPESYEHGRHWDAFRVSTVGWAYGSAIAIFVGGRTVNCSGDGIATTVDTPYRNMFVVMASGDVIADPSDWGNWTGPVPTVTNTTDSSSSDIPSCFSAIYDDPWSRTTYDQCPEYYIVSGVLGGSLLLSCCCWWFAVCCRCRRRQEKGGTVAERTPLTSAMQEAAV
jgi:hypothetical protein